jgi:hypothetical protein
MFSKKSHLVTNQPNVIVLESTLDTARLVVTNRLRKSAPFSIELRDHDAFFNMGADEIIRFLGDGVCEIPDRELRLSPGAGLRTRHIHAFCGGGTTDTAAAAAMTLETFQSVSYVGINTECIDPSKTPHGSGGLQVYGDLYVSGRIISDAEDTRALPTDFFDPVDGRINRAYLPSSETKTPPLPPPHPLEDPDHHQDHHHQSSPPLLQDCVGIGTTVPKELLHVHGKVYIEDGVEIGTAVSMTRDGGIAADTLDLSSDIRVSGDAFIGRDFVFSCAKGNSVDCKSLCVSGNQGGLVVMNGEAMNPIFSVISRHVSTTLPIITTETLTSRGIISGTCSGEPFTIDGGLGGAVMIKGDLITGNGGTWKRPWIAKETMSSRKPLPWDALKWVQEVKVMECWTGASSQRAYEFSESPLSPLPSPPPWLVEDDGGTTHVNMEAVIATLWNAVHQLSRRVCELENAR